MKKTKRIKIAIVSLLLVCVLGICGCGSAKYSFNITTDHDFRGIDLGASPAIVKATETSASVSETALGGKTILQYKNATVDGFTANIMYTIDENDTFASGSVYYQCNEKEVDAVYDSLVAKCKELYGTSYAYFDTESIHWKIGGKYVCVLKSKGKVVYNVCTEKDYNGE